MTAQKFCILSIPRTGSSLLVTALRQHPQILCHGEIFHPHVDWHIFGQARNAIDLTLRTSNPVEFVNRIYSENDGAKFVGFKIFRGHNDVALDDILHTSEIKKIVLRRSNALASYSSHVLAEKTDVWNSEEDIRMDETIEFDQVRFSEHIEWERETYSLYNKVLSNTCQSHLSISYADVVQAGFGAVLSFLGADLNVEVTAKTKKLYSSHIIDRFKNPAQVLAFLHEIGHPEWAHE